MVLSCSEISGQLLLKVFYLMETFDWNTNASDVNVVVVIVIADVAACCCCCCCFCCCFCDDEKEKKKILMMIMMVAVVVTRTTIKVMIMVFQLHIMEYNPSFYYDL